MNEIKIPYGKSDFKVLREKGYIYVDKTEYIERLDNYPFTIYVRPRRFGKSLFTSMLSYYYDISEKENYDMLFKGLYIYDNPVSDKNNYYILKFNFSGMDIEVQNSKNNEYIKEQFNDKVYVACKEFVKKYNLEITLPENKSASITLLNLLSKFKGLKKENKIYIIIDEYDHFTNGMLEFNVDSFTNSVGSGGFVRAFYEVIKEYAEGTDSVVDRFFATGIAPLTLDSLTSGFNIATNISLYPNFVEMCGLTEKELKELIKRVGLKKEVYEELEKNYDGYRFSRLSDLHTFNVTLVMYYLRYYIEMKKAPETPIDQNLATTGNKIEAITRLVTPEKNYNKLVELITEGEVSGVLVDRFELNSNTFDENSFLSLLFYQGYITIKDVGYDVRFCIPNYVSEILYAGYFTKMVDTKEKYKMEVSQINEAIKDFGEKGNIENVTKVVSNFLTYQSVRDKENFTEKTLKYVYSLFFSLSNQYYVYGEFPALQGFADILVEKSKVSLAKYESVIELKYLNKEKAKTANHDKLKEEAILQMKKYMRDKRLNEKENLKKFVIIFEGFDKYTVYEV